MTDEEMQRDLEGIADLAERLDVREFLAMSPVHQRVHTYRKATESDKKVEDLRTHVDQRFDEVLEELAEMRKPLWKQVAAPMGAAFAVAIAYLDPNLPRLH